MERSRAGQHSPLNGRALDRATEEESCLGRGPDRVAVRVVLLVRGDDDLEFGAPELRNQE